MPTVKEAISNKAVTDALRLAQLSLDVLQVGLEGVHLSTLRQLNMNVLNGDPELTLLTFKGIEPFMKTMMDLVQVEDEVTKLPEEWR